jgi:hypothetical protein
MVTTVHNTSAHSVYVPPAFKTKKTWILPHQVSLSFVQLLKTVITSLLGTKRSVFHDELFSVKVTNECLNMIYMN